MRIGSLAILVFVPSFLVSSTRAAEQETLPRLDGTSPTTLSEMWAGFDPRAEPLEVEILQEWQEEGVQLQVLRYRVGVFKGVKAKVAAIFGYPIEAADRGEKLPGLVQIHGGGQYAHYRACITNAKRGYATISIAWAGRISAPSYQVSPKEVQLFWDGKTDDPQYRVTTDWGAVDGYHAPGRNPGNVFPSAKAAEWTLDEVESPRNSGWFLCALAARRALTFLEQQPIVDADRLGVYGHSMGGKLTVLASIDERVKAAAPSCGGISDRYNDSDIFRRTLGDDVSLRAIKCPVFFLSPANDFHGRIGDLPSAVREIQSEQWRVTCSPHHNHQDTAEYEVATQLWFDEHLRGVFEAPETPRTALTLKTDDGVPSFVVQPDRPTSVLGVDVFYTQQGKAGETQRDINDAKHRFWHHAKVIRTGNQWQAELPLSAIDKPLWIYANVRYPLEEPVSGVGYYYGDYTATEFNLSSLLEIVTAEELQQAGCKVALEPSLVIEEFSEDWEKGWFTYRPNEWGLTTNKLNSPLWQAPEGATLAINVQSPEPNKMVVRIGDHAAELSLSGGEASQKVVLSPDDFKNYAGEGLSDWRSARQIKLSAAEHLRPGRGQSGSPRRFGAAWKGEAPTFRSLRWVVD